MGLVSRITHKVQREGLSGVARAIKDRVKPKRTIDENALILTLFDKIGTMIDVGACHGAALEPFAAMGWEIFAFEPDPENRQILEVRTADRKNVTISPLAITEKDGETLTFYASDESYGISSLTAFTEGHRPVATVTTIRLDTFMAENNITTLDYLKIDAEGHDLFVLRSFPSGSVSPSVILCEFEDRKTLDLGYSMQDMGNHLVANGYEVFISEWAPIERYGISHTWRNFMPFPAKLEDKNAWGNLVAVHQRSPFIAKARKVFAARPV